MIELLKILGGLALVVAPIAAVIYAFLRSAEEPKHLSE